MKSNQSFVNLALSTGLALALLIGLAATGPALAQPVGQAGATPAAENTQQNSPQAETPCDTSRTVQVSGASLVNVAPDRVLVQLGVQTNGSTPSQVQAANQRAMESVARALRAQGVEEKDIATDVYVIDPVYSDYDSLTIKGYRINNLVAVTLRDVTRTSDLIASTLEAGANQVVNVEFYTSQLRKYRDQAREMAMQAAQEKAAALAGTAGARPGCVLSIQESTSSNYNGWWYGRSQNLWGQNSIQNVAPAGGATTDGELGPVSLGMIGIRAEVSVTYSLD